MSLSDPAASRAVLIGVHSYRNLTQLPAVRRNLTDLRAALMDSAVWGLPAEHCRVVAQPDNPKAVLAAVRDMGQQASDTLFVYYAGHGLTDPDSDELYLTLRDSELEFPATALAYTFVRRAILDPRVRARRKVVVLDCCYSGRALVGGMGAVDEVADRTLIEGTYVLTASAETAVALSPPGEAHTAFTGELITLLTHGVPGGPELLTTDAIYRHLHAGLEAKGRPLPQQRSRNTGGHIALVRNRAWRPAQPSGQPAQPLVGIEAEPAGRPAQPLVAIGATAAGPPPTARSRLRRSLNSIAFSRRASVAIAAVLAVGLATAVVMGRWWGSRSDRPDGVPEPLRNCHLDGRPALPGATTSYSCRDPAGRPAVVALFPDQGGAETAYQQAVRESGVIASTGDCGKAAGGEHRYPPVGAAIGRVLCYTAGGKTSIVWTDAQKHTVARVDSSAGDPVVYRDWASWTGSPAFPTADERSLIDLLGGVGCHRADIADLDDFPGATVGVACDPQGDGAKAVTYYRFASLATVQSTLNGHITTAKAPPGVGCEDGKAPKFLGARRYDLRSVELGALFCHPEPDGNLVLEWSVEQLLVIGKAVGLDATALAAWWSTRRGPPVSKIVETINEQAQFPTEEERELLHHVPPRSRANCMRPSPEQIYKNVGSVSVVAIVCGPTSGPSIVFYYRYAGAKAMRDNYVPGAPKGNCTSSHFSGEGPYRRGGTTGRLRCWKGDNGSLNMEWIDDRRVTHGFAFQGTDPVAMFDWWEHDAGPIG